MRILFLLKKIFVFVCVFGLNLLEGFENILSFFFDYLGLLLFEFKNK